MTSSSFDNTYDFMFKVLVIGDSGVGKTSVLEKYKSGTFVEKHVSTIGVDFTIITIPVDGKTIKLQIWDTAGQERFRSITQSFYRGSYGIILVYDITNYSTFDSLPEWLDGVKSFNSRSNAVHILVGNKCDLETLREVDASEAQSFADSNDFVTAVETSAKSNTNIEDIFMELAREMKKRFVDDGPIESNSPPELLINGRPIPKNSWLSCCAPV